MTLIAGDQIDLGNVWTKNNCPYDPAPGLSEAEFLEGQRRNGATNPIPKEEIAKVVRALLNNNLPFNRVLASNTKGKKGTEHILIMLLPKTPEDIARAKSICAETTTHKVQIMYPRVDFPHHPVKVPPKLLHHPNHRTRKSRFSPA